MQLLISSVSAIVGAILIYTINSQKKAITDIIALNIKMMEQNLTNNFNSLQKSIVELTAKTEQLLPREMFITYKDNHNQVHSIIAKDLNGLGSKLNNFLVIIDKVKEEVLEVKLQVGLIEDIAKNLQQTIREGK